MVKNELTLMCHDILDVLNLSLIPAASTDKTKVFYYKMKGNYYEYLTEFATGNDRKEGENSLVAYKTDVAVTELPAAHPICLGFVLNFCFLLWNS